MELTWKCPELQCDETIDADNFDGYMIPMFFDAIDMHAAFHEIPQSDAVMYPWAGKALAYVMCDCGVICQSNFHKVILWIRKHVEVSYHSPCPYCHQSGELIPVLLRKLRNACPCGRALPPHTLAKYGVEEQNREEQQ